MKRCVFNYSEPILVVENWNFPKLDEKDSVQNVEKASGPTSLKEAFWAVHILIQNLGTGAYKILRSFSSVYRMVL